MKRKQMSAGILLSYISIAVRLLSGIIYTPIAIQNLGQSQYGVYSRCLSCVGYLTLLNAGVNAAYIRFYVQQKTIDDSKVDGLNAFFFKAFVVLSIIGFAGGMLMSAFSSQIFGSKITLEEYELVKRCLSSLAVSIGIEIFTCVFKSFISKIQKGSPSVVERLIPLVLDVNDDDQVELTFKKFVEKYGRLDLLVNNAGGQSGRVGDFKEHIFEKPVDQIDLIMNTNLRSAIICSRIACKIMSNQDFGHIISMSSVIGIGGKPDTQTTLHQKRVL